MKTICLALLTIFLAVSPLVAQSDLPDGPSLVLPDLNPLDLATAQLRAGENDQDVIVIIGAQWCAPCQTMKNYVMPQVAGRGGLDRLQFAYLDFDQDNEAATALMQGTAVPQVIYLKRKEGTWRPLAAIPKMTEAETVMAMIAWAQTSSSADSTVETAAIPMLPAK